MKKLALFLVAAAIGYFYQESMARPSAKDPRSDEQVIRISAKTFEFQPSEITVKKGIPVTLNSSAWTGTTGSSFPHSNCGRTSDPVPSRRCDLFRTGPVHLRSYAMFFAAMGPRR
jgi:hypothetical protein